MFRACALGATALALTGCWSSLSENELRELDRQEQAIVDLCRKHDPSPNLDRRLDQPLTRMIELARKSPGQIYDTNPTNDPSISDESTPETELTYIEGLLAGREGPPRCSKPQAARAQKALSEFDD
jgi:hypothetical protein